MNTRSLSAASLLLHRQMCLLPAASFIHVHVVVFVQKRKRPLVDCATYHPLRNAEWRDFRRFRPPSHVNGSPPEMTPLTRRDPDHTLHATSQQVRCQQLRRLQAAGQRNSLIINLVYQLPTLFLTKRHSILVSSFRIIYHQLFAGNRHESAMTMGSSVV